MKYSYTVLGHNNTPIEILVLMNIFATTMKKTHQLKTTCSSTLECSAFNGAGNAISYSPWKKYNNNINENAIIVDKNKAKELLTLDESKGSGYNVSNNWEDSWFASMLSSLYDKNLDHDKKSSFIVHYDAKSHDHIGHVISFAEKSGIDVFDLNIPENRKRILSMLKKKINIEEKIEEVIENWKENPPIGVVSCLKEELVNKAKVVKKLQI